MSRVDLLVFGATSFTGKFVIRDVMKLAAEKGNLKWGVAGRNENKLKDLLQDLSNKTGECVTDVLVIIADTNDEKTVSQMASKTKVIINCVGPFNLYGEPVVKACIEQRTHLIDITGEVEYMKTIRLKYNERAAEKGVYIVNACGLISVLTDIGILHFLDNFDGEVNSVELYTIPRMIANIQGSFINYGSWQSYVYDTSLAGELKQQPGQHSSSLLNLSPKLKRRAFLHKRDIVNAWCLPFISSDNSVAVSSQQYFYENEKKQPIQIQSYIGFRQLWVALIFALLSLLFVIMTKTSFTRKLLLKVSSKYTAYFVMAITSVLSGITVLKEVGKMPGKGGVFTPASAFHNTSLQQELAAHGIKFEVISTKVMN